MAGDLGSLRQEVSRRTREIGRLQYLLAPNTNNDPAREVFQKTVRELAQDISALNAEIDKARNLGATDTHLRDYQPDRLAPTKPPPAFKPADATEISSQHRRRAAPIINGPADPSGASSGYQQVTSDVKAYNEQDLPAYKQAQEAVRYAVYAKSGLDERDAIVLVDLVLSAGLRGSETGAEILNVLTAARDRFRNARDQVACMNLILAFGQWLGTDQGRAGLGRVLAKYVTTPTGFVETPEFFNAVAREFPGVQPARAENLSEQLRTHRGWERQVEQLMSEQRARFSRPSEVFTQSATAAFGRLLAGACSLGMTIADLEARVSAL